MEFVIENYISMIKNKSGTLKTDLLKEVREKKNEERVPQMSEKSTSKSSPALEMSPKSVCLRFMTFQPLYVI